MERARLPLRCLQARCHHARYVESAPVPTPAGRFVAAVTASNKTRSRPARAFALPGGVFYFHRELPAPACSHLGCASVRIIFPSIPHIWTYLVPLLAVELTTRHPSETYAVAFLPFGVTPNKTLPKRFLAITWPLLFTVADIGVLSAFS